jgi:carboxymethylenebutenolidase
METRTADIVLDGRTVVSARPDAPGPWPGVVMLHEGWGIDDVLRRHAVRLASAGYLVHAPDLLGEGPWLRCVVSTFRAFQARSGKPFELIESCRQALRADPDCTGKVGVIGFCMGGGFALLLSAEGYDAASVNYGMVPSDIDELAARAGPIVASYGGRDWTAKNVPALRDALRTHDVPHDVEVYSAAGHCFLNDKPNGPLLFRPVAKLAHAGPEPVSAAHAWRRIEAFFAEHLGAGSLSNGPGDPKV